MRLRWTVLLAVAVAVASTNALSDGEGDGDGKERGFTFKGFRSEPSSSNTPDIGQAIEEFLQKKKKLFDHFSRKRIEKLKETVNKDHGEGNEEFVYRNLAQYLVSNNKGDEGRKQIIQVINRLGDGATKKGIQGHVIDLWITSEPPPPLTNIEMLDRTWGEAYKNALEVKIANINLPDTDFSELSRTSAYWVHALQN